MGNENQKQMSLITTAGKNIVGDISRHLYSVCKRISVISKLITNLELHASKQKKKTN